jgi:ubiquinone/menaquinone biosynthesis C-methylase UbiE
MINRYFPEEFYEKKGLYWTFIEKKRFVQISKFLKESNITKILDVGCGDGVLSEFIKKRNNYIGMDISKSLIKRAKKRYKGFNFMVADAANIPFKNNTFDIVVCSEVLEHTLSPKKIIKELWRVLKENGMAIISIPNEPLQIKLRYIGIKTRIFKLMKLEKGIYQKWHIHILNEEKIIKLLKKYFKIEKVVYSPYRLLPLTVVIKCRKK